MLVAPELVFTNGVVTEASQEPCFLSDNGIQGRISILAPKNVKFDLVKISLEGILLNSIRSSALCQDARKLQVLLRMSDIKKRSDFVRHTDKGYSVSTCSFHFHVPQCLGRNLLGEDSEYLSDLPPSLVSSEDSKNGAGMSRQSPGESRVFYTIRADVFRKELAIGAITRPVRIITSLKTRPPICVADFGNEYTTRSTKKVKGKNRFSLNKVGNCTVEAEEPQSVNLKRPNESFTVSIPLTVTSEGSLTSRQHQHDVLPSSPLSQSMEGDRMKCTGALVSSMYISVVPRREIPTREEARKVDTLIRNASVCSQASASLQTSSDQIQYHDSDTWKCKMVARLTFNHFKDNSLLIPSFDSSLISHRYRITLDLQLTALSRATFSLDIPITIRYSSDNTSDDQPPAFEEISPPQIDTGLGSSSESVDRPSAALSEGIEQQPTSLDTQSLPQAEHEQHANLSRHVNLPVYHPRSAGIAAPPYVV